MESDSEKQQVDVNNVSRMTKVYRVFILMSKHWVYKILIFENLSKKSYLEANKRESIIAWLSHGKIIDEIV